MFLLYSTSNLFGYYLDIKFLMTQLTSAHPGPFPPAFKKIHILCNCCTVILKYFVLHFHLHYDPDSVGCALLKGALKMNEPKEDWSQQ